MFDWARSRLPEHVVPRSLLRRYLATGLTRRRFVRQVLSVSAAVLVALGVLTTVRDANDLRRSWGTTRPVIMTTSPIEAGDEITRSALRVTRVPVAIVPDEAVPATSDGGPNGALPTDLLGERAATRLGVGEILTESDLIGTAKDRVVDTLASGESAVTIPLAGGSVGFDTGDRVDVYGPVADEDGPQTSPGVAGFQMSLLCHRARILGVDETTVTLSVPDPQVPRVLTAAATGHVSLVLTG